MSKIPRLVLIIGVLAFLESLLRLGFYYMAAYAGVQLLQQMPAPAVMQLINFFSLALGVAGLLTVPALLLGTRWGYVGILAISGLTVIFDGWAAATVSATAFAGLVLPVVFLVLLIPKHAAFLGGIRR